MRQIGRPSRELMGNIVDTFLPAHLERHQKFDGEIWNNILLFREVDSLQSGKDTGLGPNTSL